MPEVLEIKIVSHNDVSHNDEDKVDRLEDITDQELIGFMKGLKGYELEEFLIYAKNLFDYFRKKPTKDEIIEYLSEIVNKKDVKVEEIIGSSAQRSLEMFDKRAEYSSRQTLDLLKFNKFEICNEMKDNINTVLSKNETISSIQESIKELSESFRSNSSRKGEYSQNKFLENLYEEFPEHDIIDTSDQGYLCDFELKKEDCPDILIELKNYNSPIPKREIEKFHRDTFDSGKCGILVSISSGISNKKDFSFEIISKDGFNCILFYIHNNGFNCCTVRYAVSVIYKLYSIEQNKKMNEKIEISSEVMENLKREYITFSNLKENVITKLKETIKDINKIDIRSLDNIIKNKVDQDKSPKKNWCDICQKCLSSKTALVKHTESKHKSV